MLVLLYLDNQLSEGTANFLSILHRGRVECASTPAWPLPRHSDEHGVPILEQVYGNLFRQEKEQLVEVSALTAWDDFEPIEPRVIHLCPYDDERELFACRVAPEKVDRDSYVPFTTWQLGPFTKSGPHLIALRMALRGETYSALTEKFREFTIDGPSRLLARIRHDDLLRVPVAERPDWLSGLEPFEEERLLLGEGYDVILLGSPFADNVETLDQTAISVAPLQAELEPKQSATRFISTSQRFTMTLRLATTMASDARLLQTHS